MASFHILNGDSLAYSFRETGINQDFMICQECLVVGEVKANTLKEFWAVRSEFISSTYHVSKQQYYDKTVHDFEKLNALPADTEVCLWFEHDLFCQVNMWFILSFLSNHPSLKISRVIPVIVKADDLWKGFAISDASQLEQAYVERIHFAAEDIDLGKKLWAAYQVGDLDELRALSQIISDCFPLLEEVGQAHIDRFPPDGGPGRPERTLMEIMQDR
ncbi:MAG TPA: DUF1835 domain-containing protein, partial [Saprospiraceae bacterium]|nr:DUF1835 domain-containing protein [Saprospiraceae bacterium]